jgi:BCD family chlorophyll transporter-like MFS transporter
MRLVAVAGGVSIVSFCIACVALWGIEGEKAPGNVPAKPVEKAQFGAALAQVWREPHSRRFAIFIFVSMIAYSAQDLILEPFAGVVFGFTPGETTKLSGIQHAGVLCGMILVAVAGSGFGGRPFGSLRAWTIAGCGGSAVALAAIGVAGLIGPAWPLRASVFALGVTNGAYAVAAIGSMMNMVGEGTRSREGVRMGIWGAAQALAFGLGGLLGTVASDFAQWLLGTPSIAYSSVFFAEAVVFILAAALAVRLRAPVASVPALAQPAIG